MMARVTRAALAGVCAVFFVVFVGRVVSAEQPHPGRHIQIDFIPQPFHIGQR